MPDLKATIYANGNGRPNARADKEADMDLLAFVKANAWPLVIAVVVAVAVANSKFAPEGWGIIPIGAGVAAFFAARLLFKPKPPAA